LRQDLDRQIFAKNDRLRLERMQVAEQENRFLAKLAEERKLRKIHPPSLDNSQTLLSSKLKELKQMNAEKFLKSLSTESVFVPIENLTNIPKRREDGFGACQLIRVKGELEEADPKDMREGHVKDSPSALYNGNELSSGVNEHRGRDGLPRHGQNDIRIRDRELMQSLPSVSRYVETATPATTARTSAPTTVVPKKDLMENHRSQDISVVLRRKEELEKSLPSSVRFVALDDSTRTWYPESPPKSRSTAMRKFRRQRPELKISTTPQSNFPTSSNFYPPSSRSGRDVIPLAIDANRVVIALKLATDMNPVMRSKYLEFFEQLAKKTKDPFASEGEASSESLL
jgi:hypothetical protein